MSWKMLWHAVWWKFTNILWKPTDFLNPKDGGSEILENIGNCLLDTQCHIAGGSNIYFMHV